MRPGQTWRFSDILIRYTSNKAVSTLGYRLNKLGFVMSVTQNLSDVQYVFSENLWIDMRLRPYRV